MSHPVATYSVAPKRRLRLVAREGLFRRFPSRKKLHHRPDVDEAIPELRHGVPHLVL